MKMKLSDARLSLLIAVLAFAIAVPPAAAAAEAEAVVEKSLYERLGGYEGVSAIVDEFADRLFHDKRISQFFIGMGDDTRASFKQKNKNLVCNVNGGPCKIISRSADDAHDGLGITAADFDVVAGHLMDVLNEFKVPEREQGELFEIILGLRPAIVDLRTKRSSARTRRRVASAPASAASVAQASAIRFAVRRAGHGRNWSL